MSQSQPVSMSTHYQLQCVAQTREHLFTIGTAYYFRHIVDGLLLTGFIRAHPYVRA